jgi:hypothetical protein
VAGRGVRAEDTNPGTTPPASLELTDSSGPPLLGGRAGGFSRRAGVRGLASGLPGRLGLLLGQRLAFIRSWTEVRLRTEGAGLIRPSPVRFQGLSNPGIVAEEMS